MAYYESNTADRRSTNTRWTTEGDTCDTCDGSFQTLYRMITIIVFLVTAAVGVGGFFLSNYISNKKTNNADSKGEK